MACPDDSCRQHLLSKIQILDLDYAVSTEKPLISTPYQPCAFRCPHGTTYYIEPTSDQIAKWAEEGTP